jgi:hypothetical protein
MARGIKTDEPSGRFLLRIDPGLHAALRLAAREAGLSLNDYCIRKLAGPGVDPHAPQAPALVARATALHGDSLLGVVLYGSWARGETTDASDVDALVVLDEGIPITRALYRRWDETPCTWSNRTVDPHFVHLPTTAAQTGGLWGEVAIDGIVLFERGLRISRYLGHVRREILSGRLVRRIAHGQPYWAEAS